MRKEIIQELKDRGYNAEAQDIIKNGVLKEGIVLKTPKKNISPTVYVDDFIRRGLSVDEATDACIRIFESNSSVSFDIEKLFDRDFLLEHSFLGLQKTSEEDICRQPTDFEGIEQFIYVRINIGDGLGSIKLTPVILDRANVLYEEVLASAEKNTFAETKFVSITEMLGLPFEPDDSPSITCVTNSSNTKGASSILDKEKLKEYAKEHNTNRIIAIPSSIHEFIIMPCHDEDIDLDALSDLVNQVNAESVPPEEQLGTKAFVITV